MAGPDRAENAATHPLSGHTLPTSSEVHQTFRLFSQNDLATAMFFLLTQVDRI